MKYETPQMTTLTPAINAIQTPQQFKDGGSTLDSDVYETIPAYADWE